MTSATHISEPTNGAEHGITALMPYRAEVTIEGVADLLFHRWNNEAVQEKADAPKGSKTKKTDDIESYVYRTPGGNLALPGEYVRQATILAAKFRQDPRSPRKSAMDLFKAGIVTLTPLADLGTAEWDYLDRRRAVVQRAAITRVRPAMLVGWRATFVMMVNLPEYIPPSMLNETIAAAGRLCGVGDFRPTYGRYQILNFAVLLG